MTQISQSNQFAFQMITNAAAASAASPRQGNAFIDEVWYLFGYPDAAKRAVDAPFINKVVTATGGSSSVVSVLAAQRGIGVLIPQQGGLVGQQGVWVLARIPTLVVDNGPILDSNLLNDGYWRLIYDVTSNVKIFSKFNTTQQLRIIQNGVVIFDANPIPGALTPLVPIANNTNAYTPQGLHFDGATGLVTATPLVTQNTGVVSFAGWFKIDPSLSGGLEFSQGSGSNKLFYDRSIPTPGAWCHMIGTVDAGANQAVVFVNGTLGIGEPTAVGSVFSSVPTNGKNLYIGTDNNGNFFKGDIADLAIWFDFSFIKNNTILPVDVGKVTVFDQTAGGVTTISPTNPAMWILGYNSLKQPYQVGVNNVNKVVQPQVFLSGPASEALTAQTQYGTLIQTVTNLNVVSGTLTNSSTNPGTITIGPPI